MTLRKKSRTLEFYYICNTTVIEIGISVKGDPLSSQGKSKTSMSGPSLKRYMEEMALENY